MTKRPENQSGKELAEKFTQLETVVQALTQKLELVARRQKDWDEINTEHRKLIESDVVDALERIKNIELKFFPKLIGDLSAVNKIIGEGDDRAWNPLDKRKP